jgi:hypothetical protein
MAQTTINRIDNSGADAQSCFREAGRKLQRRHGFTEEQVRRNAAKLRLTEQETAWLLSGWHEEHDREQTAGGRR